jgi:hypothetical protein
MSSHPPRLKDGIWSEKVGVVIPEYELGPPNSFLQRSFRSVQKLSGCFFDVTGVPRIELIYECVFVNKLTQKVEGSVSRTFYCR